jgi:uncharacterized protein YndB with AHSA1/START domain
MKNNLLFDFTAEQNTKTVFITREFDAELSLVWDAFTKQEILDQWTAPAPWVSKTKYMKFEVGGKRFYAMVSPDGQERWAIQEYTSITPKPILNFTMLLQTKMKTLNYRVLIGITLLANKTERQQCVLLFIMNRFARMEKMIEMGFKEGFTMTLNYLEQLLITVK